MLKAEQSAVVQQANSGLVAIRSVEVAYFSQFFSYFGTQCALMAGFSICSVSQTPALADSSTFLRRLYWISSAIAAMTGLYALLGALYCSVYGQGLALRGPPGSMVFIS